MTESLRKLAKEVLPDLPSSENRNSNNNAISLSDSIECITPLAMSKPESKFKRNLYGKKETKSTRKSVHTRLGKKPVSERLRPKKSYVQSKNTFFKKSENIPPPSWVSRRPKPKTIYSTVENSVVQTPVASYVQPMPMSSQWYPYAVVL